MFNVSQIYEVSKNQEFEGSKGAYQDVLGQWADAIHGNHVSESLGESHADKIPEWAKQAICKHGDVRRFQESCGYPSCDESSSANLMGLFRGDEDVTI